MTSLLNAAVLLTVFAASPNTDKNPYGIQALPGGFIKADVVSYSYVPNRYWTLEEAKGILPYLCEYELMAWSGDKPLDAYHAENVRRIDLASQWSTAIMFYARRFDFRDEIINLMLRAYRHRQLFILRDYWKPGDAHEPFDKTLDLLTTLWAGRDRVFTNPEGDRATGRRLIDNILMVKAGDEYFCTLRTEGLEKTYSAFKQRIQAREMDGRTPFSHIKAWYNMVAYSAWDFGSCWASCENDITEHGRAKLPPNTEFIGVDTYDYWWSGIGYDPIEPANRDKVLARVAEWHRIRTQYYPEGVATSVCKNAKDPATWTPQCWSDTHALANAINLAGADKGMMIYIGLSSSLKGQYTTPVETMDAYYDNCKAGPWVGLIWWTAVGKMHPKEYPLGTLGYVDKTLVHYTPDEPKGMPYTAAQLDTLHDKFIASRKRMFNDVVYGQFGFINKRPGTLSEN